LYSSNNIKSGDLVKITGRSFLPFKEKPYFLVLDTITGFAENEFVLFCADSNRVFYWSDKSYGCIVKVNEYYLKNKEL